MQNPKAAPRTKKIKSEWITIRATATDKAQIESDAKAAGLDNVSAYLLQLYRKHRSG